MGKCSPIPLISILVAVHGFVNPTSVVNTRQIVNHCKLRKLPALGLFLKYRLRVEQKPFRNDEQEILRDTAVVKHHFPQGFVG